MRARKSHFIACICQIIKTFMIELEYLYSNIGLHDECVNEMLFHSHKITTVREI